MKNIIMIICAAAFTLALQAQIPIPYISYVYNNAGNRVQRKYIDMSNTRQTHGNTTNTTTNELQTTETLNDVKTPEVITQPLNDKLTSHDILIYPNPTKGKIVLSISNLSNDEPATISIYDINGKAFYSTKTGDISTTIDISDKPANTYFMRIEIAGKQTVWDIIKQ